jgi:protein-S-isoprenylcysteine O-methyltransferase Ste14
MDNQLFFILVMLCITTHIVRSIYEILKFKNIVKPNKLTFAIIFTNMGLLWSSWFVLCSRDPNKINIPVIVHYFGFALFGLGFIVFLTALFTIKTLESYEGDLITTGIYSTLRHPMYFGFILWLIGFPMYFEAFFSFILSLVFIANVLFWRYLEEKELEKRFISYIDYKKTTVF